MEQNKFNNIKKPDNNLEKRRNDEVIVIGGKTEEELIDLARIIFDKLDNNGHPVSYEYCKDGLSKGGELRPNGFAIYLMKGQLYIDSRSHNTDKEMKAFLEQVVLESLEEDIKNEKINVNRNLKEEYISNADSEGYIYVRDFAIPELDRQTKNIASLLDGEEGTMPEYNLGIGLRHKGSAGNYSEMKIHIDDLQEFIWRVKAHYGEK
ncbi:MAG: hypothetical protein WCS86_00860 [Candidatus Paceibacterota bacterium]